MAASAALLISGLAFLFGAFCAERWSSPDSDLAWLYVTGGVLVVAPLAVLILYHMLIRSGPMLTRVKAWLATPPDLSPGIPPSRRWLLAIPLAYLLAVVGSVLHGMPAKLPGVALGLPLLLDLERATALLAGIAAVLIFAVLTSRGRLPTRFGNVGYAEDRRDEETRRVTELSASLQPRLFKLETADTENERAQKLIGEELGILRARLDEIEAQKSG